MSRSLTTEQREALNTAVKLKMQDPGGARRRMAEGYGLAFHPKAAWPILELFAERYPDLVGEVVGAAAGCVSADQVVRIRDEPFYDSVAIFFDDAGAPLVPQNNWGWFINAQGDTDASSELAGTPVRKTQNWTSAESDRTPSNKLFVLYEVAYHVWLQRPAAGEGAVPNAANEGALLSAVASNIAASVKVQDNDVYPMKPLRHQIGIGLQPLAFGVNPGVINAMDVVIGAAPGHAALGPAQCCWHELREVLEVEPGSTFRMPLLPDVGGVLGIPTDVTWRNAVVRCDVVYNAVSVAGLPG